MQILAVIVAFAIIVVAIGVEEAFAEYYEESGAGVAWDKAFYEICDTGTITIYAEEENTNPNLIQTFFIQVTSDSDYIGFEVGMIETGNNSGIFVGFLQLCELLSVSEGDRVYAHYGKVVGVADIISSYSQSPALITLKIDKLSYKFGDTIKISGELTPITSSYPVAIIITGPTGNTVTAKSVDVVGNGYALVLKRTYGASWEESGTYIIKAIHGKGRTAETSFWFGSSSSSPPSSSYSPPSSATLVSVPAGASAPGCEMTDECYVPAAIFVKTGQTVTWTNNDKAAHTITSGYPSDGPDGTFDSSMFMASDTFSHEFSQAGKFPYFCMVHPWMVGTVIVEGSTSEGGIITRDTIPPKILQPEDIVVDLEDGTRIRVDYEVLAIDDVDQIVRPSCSPSSGSFFPVGDTEVVCSASDMAGNEASKRTFLVTVNTSALSIPVWIKDVAAFWCDEKINDSSFIEGIQYLIDNDVIIITGTSVGSVGQEIPSWIKNNACWWSYGHISDVDFAQGLEFLVREGIIRV